MLNLYILGPVVVVVLALILSLGGALHYYKSQFRSIEKQRIEVESQLNLTENILQRQSESIKKSNVELETYRSRLKDLESSTRSKYKDLNSSKVSTCEDLSKFIESLGEVDE